MTNEDNGISEEPSLDIPEELEIDDTPEVKVPEQKTATIKEQNVIQESEIFIPMTKEEWNTSEETVALPSDISEVVVGAINKAPNVNLTDSVEARKWANVMAESMRQSSFTDAFVPTLVGDDSEFVQGVDSETGKLAGSHPKFKAIANENVKGERGVLRFM